MAPIKAYCEDADNAVLRSFGEQLNACASIRDRIERELNPDAPNATNRGNVIRTGVNDELDSLREISYSGKDYLLKIQQRESELTGIPSLKVAYNNVFGYYIEVRNTHKDKVPEGWIRKQTLVNAERYVTQELKEYEEKILGAEEKILSLETRLFNDLVAAVATYIPAIQLNASLVARLDCLMSFTRVSIENRYNRPEVNESLDIDIVEGRHPVIEKQLPPGESYIANNVTLGNESQQIMMITGPNMAGKSALLRQTALIVLMAQIGCFVPADAAKIGIVDKIFTRVGASDNISLGESTFMVEMNEAASILNNLSERSLVLFDELGRGTSTYDGISIAWSIVEYIHENPRFHAKLSSPLTITNSTRWQKRSNASQTSMCRCAKSTERLCSSENSWKGAASTASVSTWQNSPDCRRQSSPAQTRCFTNLSRQTRRMPLRNASLK